MLRVYSWELCAIAELCNTVWSNIGDITLSRWWSIKLCRSPGLLHRVCIYSTWHTYLIIIEHTYLIIMRRNVEGGGCMYTGGVTIEMVVASCVVKRAFSPSPVTSSADVLGKESNTSCLRLAMTAVSTRAWTYTTKANVWLKSVPLQLNCDY